MTGTVKRVRDAGHLAAKGTCPPFPRPPGPGAGTAPRSDDGTEGLDGLDSLANLLRPLDRDAFLADLYGRTYCHVPGQAEKFRALFTWDALNRILERPRLEHTRCRLVRDAGLIDPTRLRTATLNRRGDRVERLKPETLMAHLRDGATLIVDSVHELCPPLSELVISLGRVLHEPVEINAYVSCGRAPGYGPHFDNHDVFVIQIAGRKRWRIYPTTAGPDPESNGHDHVRGDTAPVFDQTIQAGDLLYIPHGTTHEVTGLSEPSLHLTIGVTKKTGLDLLAWVVEQLRETAPFNTDLPRFANIETRTAHAASLLDHLTAFWRGDILDRYFADQDGNAPLHPRFALPWVGPPLALPRDGHRQLRYAGTTWQSGASTEADTRSVSCRFGGKSIDLPARILDMVRPLLDGGTATLEDLCQAAADKGTAERQTLSAINDLLEKGVLQVER